MKANCLLSKMSIFNLKGRGQEKEPGKREGGQLFKGGDYFNYFARRAAIIQGRQLIEGRLLIEEMQ